MKRVWIFGGGAYGDELAEALSARAFVVEPCPPGDLVPAAREAMPCALLFAVEDGAQPAELLALVKRLRAEGLPVVVSFPGASPAARDQLLIAGAEDVSTETLADDAAARVDAAVNGWLRVGPRRPLARPLRAQRGRRMFDLPATELDPSGLSLTSAQGLTDGDLLRVAVPLPGGELIAWGRVVDSGDAGPGVRFLGLSAADRQRLVTALRVRRRDAAEEEPVREVDAVNAQEDPSGSSKGNPAAPAPPVFVMAPPADSGLEEPADGPVEEPAAAPHGEGVPAASPESRVSDGLIPSRLSDADNIAAALGELVGEDRQMPGAGADVAGERDEAELSAWPAVRHDEAATLAALRDFLSTGLASGGEGAPPGARIVDFCRTLSPLERRAFDEEPPAELPDTALTMRCLGLRLRLFDARRDAEGLLAQGTAVRVDDEALGSLGQEVRALGAELQRMADGVMASAQTTRLRDLNVFRNSLFQPFTDLRSVAARLRGEQAETAASAVMLDAAAEGPSPATYRREPPKPKEAVHKHQPGKTPRFSSRVPSPAARRRRRYMWLGLLLGGAVLARVLTWPAAPRRFGPEELAQLPGVISVLIEERHVATRNSSPVVVTVSAAWQPEASGIQTLQHLLRRYGASSFVVLDSERRLLARGGVRAGAQVTILERRTR